ncbi:uncharacterized protein [Bemisia tabaci]|uniref:uncharacterized protein isoform X2 n=1 Tax=Bemisia tabaci TaxID=7038 RepID=UPI003B2824BC
MVKEGNPHAIHDPSAMDGVHDAVWWRYVYCERHTDEKRIRNIYRTVNFIAVRVELDPVSVPHADPPRTVRIGIPFQPLDYPPFREDVQKIQYDDEKVNDLCEKKVLDCSSKESFLNFLSITNLQSVMKPDITVMARLAAFVNSMNRVVNNMYLDAQRSVFEGFFKYRGQARQTQLRAIAQHRVDIKEGTDLLLPEMLDPCFITAFQKKTNDTAEFLRSLADDYCTSYCKFLAAAARFVNCATRYKCDQLLWGRCREFAGVRNVCFCVQAPYVFSFWAARDIVASQRWIPGAGFVRMTLCNNALLNYKFL